MGKKSAPPAPDYAAAAEKQGQASEKLTTQQTWANRPTLNTPWGSQTWSTTPTIDPATGQSVSQWTSNITLSPEQQKALDSQMAIQQGRSDAANQLLGQATGAFQRPANWGALPQGGQNVQLGGMQGYSGTPGGVQTSVGQGGQVQSSLQGAGPLQSSLQYNPNQIRQQAQDSVWNLQKPMLDEQRAGLENRLANQGISQGSEAWNSAMRQQSDAEARAQLAAIQTGQSEAGQLFGQGLASGQFANQAQAQQFGQNLAAGQFNNQALAQQFGQNLAGGQFANQAQQQQFNQGLSQQQFNNNTALQQLQGNIAAGNYNNQNRQQAIAEMMQQRSQPLNELNALLTGQQVNMPQMPSFNSAQAAQAPQYLNAANMQYQGALNAFNAQQQGLSGLASGLFSLGSAAMSSPTGWAGLFNFGG